MSYGTLKTAGLTNNVKVYPNPFSNKLVIEGEKLANSRIFDLQGRVIFEQVINKGKNNLDLSNLQKGVYIIDINGLKQKIVKQ